MDPNEHKITITIVCSKEEKELLQRAADEEPSDGYKRVSIGKFVLHAALEKARGERKRSRYFPPVPPTTVDSIDTGDLIKAEVKRLKDDEPPKLPRKQIRGSTRW